MKYAKIGGQAVIEGVMMRYGNDYAVTVRKPDGTLEVKKDTYVSLVSRLHLKNVPVVRGVFAFIDSMVLGISTLTYSASFYDDDGQPIEKAPGTPASEPVAGNAKKADTKPSDGGSFTEKLVMGLTVALSVVIAIGLFMVLPFFISGLFKNLTQSTWALRNY